MIGREELRDFDLAWMGVDEAGHVAIFTTGGQGPVPATSMPSIETAEEDVLALPATSAAEAVVEGGHAAFRGFAERGLFVYDWSDVHRANAAALHAYELQCRPLRPMRIDELPPALQVAAAASPVRGVRFGAALVPAQAVGPH